MSDKLSEQLCMIAGALETTNPLRGRRIEHIAKKVAALEQQLAAKDAEIARLRWHPIATAPTKCEWILGIAKNAGGFWMVPSPMRFTSKGWGDLVNERWVFQPEFWMPFPDNPTPNPSAVLAETPAAPPRPKIVCLCGSTRFYEHFQSANYEQTMAGNIVLSVGFYPHAQKEIHHSGDVGCTAEQKIALDALHKRKIDLADEVFVLNVGSYIGSSTRSEIDYAIEHGKPVRYLETPAAPEVK